MELTLELILGGSTYQVELNGYTLVRETEPPLYGWKVKVSGTSAYVLTCEKGEVQRVEGRPVPVNRMAQFTKQLSALLAHKLRELTPPSS